MIPAASELIAACEYLARRFSWERRLRPNLIRKIHSDATQLARLPNEEPAALFYAFSRSFDLIAEDYTIDLKRGISAGLHSFETVRRWFAEKLVPVHH